MDLNTVRFTDDRLFIIDQTRLPNEAVEIELKNLEQVLEAIKKLRVRGAPAIGITAAYAFYQEIKRQSETESLTEPRVVITADILKQARPTAVNLEWAVDRIRDTYHRYKNESSDVCLNKIRQAAISVHEQDRETCRKIGEHGASLIRDGFNILTHCNAGILATGGMGTALAAVYTAHKQKKKIHVYVDETRPLGQGTRLTYWELQKYGVPATLITDNMSGSLMRSSKIDMVVVGADRIARNGDFANKIGTYNLAVLAHFHKIPFYCAAPRSTFDPNLKDGDQINIEMRDKREVTSFWNVKDPDSFSVYNPAFDITPYGLLSGIITENGILKKPFKQNINNFLIN